MNGITVILANGSFPTHPVPCAALHAAQRIVCCDGAVDALLNHRARVPDVIVGDGDSLSAAMRSRFADRLVLSSCQETNDLTKAFRYCVEHGWQDILILGATGKREDHTLGNLALLADFSHEASVRMKTDTCVITPVALPMTLIAFKGQAVSFVACDAGVTLTAEGVRYPVQDLALTRWHTATLNTATSDQIRVVPSHGVVLVFQTYA